MASEKDKQDGRWSRAAELSTVRHKKLGQREVAELGDWTRMFKPNWKEVFLDEELGKIEIKVLGLCAVEASGPKNVIPYTQREIAAETGFTVQSVNRAFRLLMAKGLIFRQGHTYRINSRLVTDRPTLNEVMQLRREEVQEFFKG